MLIGIESKSLVGWSSNDWRSIIREKQLFLKSCGITICLELILLLFFQPEMNTIPILSHLILPLLWQVRCEMMNQLKTNDHESCSKSWLLSISFVHFRVTRFEASKMAYMKRSPENETGIDGEITVLYVVPFLWLAELSHRFCSMNNDHSEEISSPFRISSCVDQLNSGILKD
jgi:hypothetical protein